MLREGHRLCSALLPAICFPKPCFLILPKERSRREEEKKKKRGPASAEESESAGLADAQVANVFGRCERAAYKSTVKSDFKTAVLFCVSVHVFCSGHAGVRCIITLQQTAENIGFSFLS